MRSKLGKYEIKSELGRGAMGVVYLAHDSRLGRPVALKTMSPSVAGDPELLKRFYREAQSAGQLRHPNIVTIYDIDEADGIPFIAMEFLEGESLERMIAERRDVAVVKKLDIIIQASRGLQYAHQHGIVHRDVKPANLVVLNDGLVKIVDFGIARIGSASLTRTGVIMGTPMYMSPEQIQGHPVDARSDVFSVGVILYELLTYNNPFASSDVPTILYRVLNEPPAPLSRSVPNCPAELDQVIQRAVAKDREQRFQAIEDMALELQHVADSLKRQTLDLYVEQGQRSLQAGELTLAKEALQKVLEIDSGHDWAKELLEQVQTKIYSRERSRKIEQWLRQANDALRSQQYDEAVTAFEEILRLDPGHVEARQSKQVAVERRDDLQKINAHLERADKFVAAGDYSRAKHELESALTLDPGQAAALKMMGRVVKELNQQERLKQIREFAESARDLVTERNFAKAIELLEKARELDPLNIEVETLLTQARGGEEQETRRQLLAQHLAAIEQALDRDDDEPALALADHALQEFSGDAQLIKLRAQASRLVDARKQLGLVDEHLRAARESVQKNQYAEAIATLERALQVAPGDSRLMSFLKSLQEAQAGASLEALLQQTTRQADTLIRRKDFSAAVELLEHAQASAAHSQELDSLLQYAREQKRQTEGGGRETAAYRAPSSGGARAPLGSGQQFKDAAPGQTGRSGQPAPPQAGSSGRVARAANDPIPRPAPSAASGIAMQANARDAAIPATHRKRKSGSLWAGLALALLLVAGLATWRFSGAPSPGRVECSAAPWAEVVNVSTDGGKSLNLAGQTPIELELPPGNYVIELRNGHAAAKVSVSVGPGKVTRINYQFPDTAITQMVSDLVSKY